MEKSISHTTSTVTVDVLQGIKGKPFTNPNDVSFDVKYPKDFKGQKLMPEGIVIVSKESAEQFKALGIGDIVSDSEVKVSTETEENKDTKKGKKEGK